MNSRSSFSQVQPQSASSRLPWFAGGCLLAALFGPCGTLLAADAPAWMHALVSLPLPEHDDKTDAVLLYSENILNVQPNGKLKSTERRAYKILRPGGRELGTVRISFDAETKITSLRAWCIPAQGKDYEVKEKDAIETALFGVANGELMTDERTKILQIPASDVGNIIGYEEEHDGRPYVLQDRWSFQTSVPVREARYTLQLPAGWQQKVVWLNHPDVAPASVSPNQWQWVVTNVKALLPEDDMPPWGGMVGQMIVSLFPPAGGQNRAFQDWKEMGNWEANLDRGRRDPSPEIKQKVVALTSGLPTTTAKMQALAKFLQHDIRYVAIELGIGGWQPHPAAEIFTHRYGDCKDKATLMSSMLKEIGVDSYYVSINTERGALKLDMPPTMFWFNHEILAIRLPDDVKGPEMAATVQHAKLGTLLIFDPTDELTPLGQLRGALQANHGLLVAPDGGELLRLPQLHPSTNGVSRTATLVLDASGTLRGEIREVHLGDRAVNERYELRSATKDADKIKPVETLLAHSLASFQIQNASVVNLTKTDEPFEFHYTIVSPAYAKPAGNLLLVRPRVVGSKTRALLETKEPRKFPVEFDGPERDTDTFEIRLPAGYEPDDLPPPVNVDMGFASYQSKSEVNGSVLKYTRTFEVKDLSVPLSRMDDLKKLYRIIAGDERNTAVLRKP